MDLQQEYFVRNEIGTPLIRFVPGKLLLKAPNYARIASKWTMLSICYTNRDGDAGKFELFEHMPIHNTHAKSRSFFAPPGLESLTKHYECHWENYEEMIYGWVARLSAKKQIAVLDRHELTVACLEMLLYSYDDFFAGLPFRYQNSFHEALDDDIPIQERSEKVSQYLYAMYNDPIAASSNVKHILQGWQFLCDMLDVNTYAFWLAQMVNNNDRIRTTLRK